MLSVFRMAHLQNQNEREVLCMAELASHAMVVNAVTKVHKNKIRNACDIAFSTYCWVIFPSRKHMLTKEVHQQADRF